MLTETKKQEIITIMKTLKGKKREKFGMFLASDFEDQDLRELTPTNADKLLKFIKAL
jgi:hypothetical protein